MNSEITLELLKSRGWSYLVGYDHTVDQNYRCSIWKDKPREMWPKILGGEKDNKYVHSIRWYISGVDKSPEGATMKCLESLQEKVDQQYWGGK